MSWFKGREITNKPSCQVGNITSKSDSMHTGGWKSSRVKALKSGNKTSQGIKKQTSHTSQGIKKGK